MKISQPTIVTCLTVGIYLTCVGLPGVLSFNDVFERSSSGSFEGSVLPADPWDGSSNPDFDTEIPTASQFQLSSKVLIPNDPQTSPSTVIFTPSRVPSPRYIYPSKTDGLISENEPEKQMDLQIVQPNFSEQTSGSTESGPLEDNLMLPSESDVVQVTKVPLEDTVLMRETVESVQNFSGSSNDYTIDQENVTEAEEEEPELEPLPTPMALISPSGEGSNPPLEEEFAEAFRLRESNGHPRKPRPGGGRRRVRMRVRKLNRGNTTDNPQEEETIDRSVDFSKRLDSDTDFTTLRPRKYRSTTPSPDVGSPTPIVTQSSLGSASVVKNGPKPIIIRDIHSGSTGLNPVTPDPQLEKPMIGGYTEKISTYFVSPPTKISTTEAPKTEDNTAFDDGDGRDAKPSESSINESQTRSESRRELWTKPFSPMQPSSSTENVVIHQSDISTGHSKNENSANLFQQESTPMQDRTSSVHTDQTINDFENNYSPNQSPPDLTPHEPYGDSWNSQRVSESNSNEHRLPFINRGKFNGYDENTPFITQTTGSHYNRNKDPFFSSNSFQSLDHDHALNGQNYERKVPQNGHPVQISYSNFQQNGFRGNTPPNSEHVIIQNHPNQIIIDHHHNIPMLEGNDPPFSEHNFQSSPNDPVLDGNVILPRPEHIPASSSSQGNAFSYNTQSSLSGHRESPSNNENSNSPTGPEMYGQGIHSNHLAHAQLPEHSTPNIITADDLRHHFQNGDAFASNFQGPSGPPEHSFNPNLSPGFGSTFAQSGTSNQLPFPGGHRVYGTVENVPMPEPPPGYTPGPPPADDPRNPVFVASSPGEPSRTPQFSPPRSQGPSFSMSRPLSFLRSHFQAARPPFHLSRYPHHSNSDGRSADFPSSQNPYLFSPQGRPNSEFHHGSPHVNLPLPGLNNIPLPPSEQDAMNEVTPKLSFPPYTHSMSNKPDYEPANPPLPHGHPLENHFQPFPIDEVVEIVHHDDDGLDRLKNYSPQSVPGNSVASGSDFTNTGPPSGQFSPIPGGTGYDILSAYYDKPPPTVGYESVDLNKPVQQDNTNKNKLPNVPYQYTHTDGAGLDSGPYFTSSLGDDNSKKPISNSAEKAPNQNDAPGPGPESQPKEESIKANVYSDTPYVLMFPQLVPEEAMLPPPPKILKEEIPVVQASSLSSMKFSPDGNPALGPGLKTVAVHPRHQMYQVLAKAHYDKMMHKYMESKKRPPSAIYTPYGVLVPMGPTTSASNNYEAYASTKTHFNQLKSPNDKHRFNILLKSNTPLGNYHLHKAASLKNGRLNKHFAFKANVDPALDLLAEKLAIKLGALKYVLSAPAKLGVHAFAKHSASELKPVVSLPPKDKGDLGQVTSTSATFSDLELSLLEAVTPDKTLSKNLKQDSSAISHEINPELKMQLKALLKERLTEALEETDIESKEHRSSVMMQPPIMSMNYPGMSQNFNPNNRWAAYFSQNSNQGRGGGLLGTIKRLFSFGGYTEGRQDYGGTSIGSKLFNSSSNIMSTHPFSWGGMHKESMFNSVGRMGEIEPNNEHLFNQSSTKLNKWPTQLKERKSKTQLDKWLDLVLKSSDLQMSASSLQPDKVGRPLLDRSKFGKQLYHGDPSSSTSSIKISNPSKSSVLSYSSESNINHKRLGHSGMTTKFLSNSWKPMVSAFKSVFHYTPSKSPTLLKPKTTLSLAS